MHRTGADGSGMAESLLGAGHEVPSTTARAAKRTHWSPRARNLPPASADAAEATPFSPCCEWTMSSKRCGV